jgi:cytoskeleton protein RodZ
MSDNVTDSVGELLRAAREAKKLSLDDANRETKISIAILTSMEADDFDAVGSDIYLKGFLRNYARFLGIDADSVLRTLDRQRGKGPIGVGTMWDIEESVTEEKIESSRVFKRFVLPLLFLIILLLTILFINERKKVKRLTVGDAQGYLKTEIVDTRSA